MECQQAPGQDQVASELCGTEGYHSCSSGPSVVVSGGRFVWCCEVGGERGSACGGRPGWGGDQQRRGGERLRCPLCVARLVAACFTPVGDRQLPDEPSASHTHPSGSAAGSAPPPSSVGEAAGSPGGWSLVSRCASRCASREVARGVEGPGRVQWVASLRPASSGSAAKSVRSGP